MKISFEILWRWVFALCLGSVVLGIVLMLLPGTGVLTAYDTGMLRPFFGADAPSPQALELYRFKMAIVGSATAGWGVTLCFIVPTAFRRREPWAWWALLVGPASWIALEAAACIMWGVTAELYFLATAALGFALPLALCRRHFVGGGTAKSST